MEEKDVDAENKDADAGTESKPAETQPDVTKDDHDDVSLLSLHSNLTTNSTIHILTKTCSVQDRYPTS